MLYGKDKAARKTSEQNTPKKNQKARKGRNKPSLQEIIEAEEYSKMDAVKAGLLDSIIKQQEANYQISIKLTEKTR